MVPLNDVRTSLWSKWCPKTSEHQRLYERNDLFLQKRDVESVNSHEMESC